MITYIYKGRKYSRSLAGEKRRLIALRSVQSRSKMSIAHKGKLPKNFNKIQRLAWQASRKEKLTYSGIHAWVRRNWGKASDIGKCALCGKKENRSRRIHWANKSHKYTRDRKDWMVVCRRCHFLYDQKHHKVNFFGGRNQKK